MRSVDVPGNWCVATLGPGGDGLGTTGVTTCVDRAPPSVDRLSVTVDTTNGIDTCTEDRPSVSVDTVHRDDCDIQNCAAKCFYQFYFYKKMCNIILYTMYNILLFDGLWFF